MVPGWHCNALAYGISLGFFYCTDLGMLRVTDGLLSGLGSAVCLAENLAEVLESSCTSRAQVCKAEE